MDNESLSPMLADFAAGLSYEGLSPELVRTVKHSVLDTLGGCIIAGAAEPAARIASGVLADLGGIPESTVLPGTARTNCLFAALANGVAAHALEMDDVHREAIIHPSAAVLPAVLAVAERTGASGRELLVAALAGMEVFIRVSLGVGKSHYRCWHTTATCGTFGAAVGAGKLLGLDREGFIQALGSAGTQAAGLWECLADSAMSKQLHPGKAAMNGILSALLAARGFTGAGRILEGEKGFFRATSRDADPHRVVDGLGTVFHTARISLKHHASCGHTHSPIDAALAAARGRLTSIGDVARVQVHVSRNALDLLGQVSATTPYLAKFCLPFCIATALAGGRVDLEAFTQERLGDPAIRSLMERIELLEDPAFTASFPRKWQARVRIATVDGRVLEAATDYPKGDPENPLSQDEVLGKFRHLTRGFVDEARAERLSDRVLCLEEQGDVRRLFDPAP